MRWLFLSLAAAAMAFSVPVLSVSSASADALTMGCNIQPSANDNFSFHCTTTYYATSYGVDFYVQGQTGTYTYVWTPPAGSTIIQGCTSTSATCQVKGFSGDQLVASVVATQGGVQTDLSAKATIPQWCGRNIC
jgi:hypothetical protein